MAYAPTFTQFVDSNPSPRCLVTFSTLAAGCQTITVTRTVNGRTMTVRGGVNVYAVGGIAVMDYEVPFGVNATYQAQMFDAAGLPLGFTDAATTLVAVTQVWVHQPLQPTLAVSPAVLRSSLADLVRDVPGGQLLYPEGATVPTWIGGQRGGLKGVGLEFGMNSTADADELQSMLGGYTTDFPAVLCIRTPPPFRIPPVFFCAVPELHEVGYGPAAYVTFTASVDEVQPPFAGLVVPTLRRADIDAAFATRGARASAYATRLARDTDFAKAGLAGP